MKVFTAKGLDGIWTSACGVVIAVDGLAAVDILKSELKSRGIRQKIKPEQLEELDLSIPKAIILDDGNE